MSNAVDDQWKFRLPDATRIVSDVRGKSYNLLAYREGHGASPFLHGVLIPDLARDHSVHIADLRKCGANGEFGRDLDAQFANPVNGNGRGRRRLQIYDHAHNPLTRADDQSTQTLFRHVTASLKRNDSVLLVAREKDAVQLDAEMGRFADPALTTLKRLARINVRGMSGEELASQINEMFSSFGVLPTFGPQLVSLLPDACPALLHVVCRHLQNQMRATGRNDLVALEVDKALASYYEKVIGEVAYRNGVNENRLFQAVDQQLGTEPRSLWLHNDPAAMFVGLPGSQHVLSDLVDAHLLRSDIHDGRRVYRLVAERLRSVARQSAKSRNAETRPPVRATKWLWVALAGIVLTIGVAIGVAVIRGRGAKTAGGVRSPLIPEPSPKGGKNQPRKRKVAPRTGDDRPSPPPPLPPPLVVEGSKKEPPVVVRVGPDLEERIADLAQHALGVGQVELSIALARRAAEMAPAGTRMPPKVAAVLHRALTARMCGARAVVLSARQLVRLADGRLLAATSSGAALFAADGSMERFLLPGADVHALAVRGRQLAAGTINYVELLDLDTGQRATLRTDAAGAARFVALTASAVEPVVIELIAGADNTRRRISPSAGAELRWLTGSFVAADAHGTGRAQVAIVTTEALVVIDVYGVASDEVPVSGATAVAFSPDGRSLAVGFSDGSVEIWNVGPKPARRRNLPDAGGSSMESLAFLHGNRLAAGDSEGRLVVWPGPLGSAPGQPLVLQPGAGPVRSLAPTAPGDSLALLEESKGLRLCAVPQANLASLAEGSAALSRMAADVPGRITAEESEGTTEVMRHLRPSVPMDEVRNYCAALHEDEALCREALGGEPSAAVAPTAR